MSYLTLIITTNIFLWFCSALIFLRSCSDVSADIEEMETELQGTGEKNAKDSDAEDGTASEKKNLSNGDKINKKEDDEFTMLRLLKSRDLRMPLFIAVFLQVIQQLSGINAVRSFIQYLVTCCLLVKLGFG